MSSAAVKYSSSTSASHPSWNFYFLFFPYGSQSILNEIYYLIYLFFVFCLIYYVFLVTLIFSFSFCRFCLYRLVSFDLFLVFLRLTFLSCHVFDFIFLLILLIVVTVFSHQFSVNFSGLFFVCVELAIKQFSLVDLS